MSIFKSAAWDFIGKIINQVIGFVVSVVLARLLTPHEFGIVGIALAFVGLSTMFLDLGFKNAIIQKQQYDQKLYSSVLWINVALSIILALVFLFGANFIAAFYKEPKVAGIIQATVLLFVINAATLLPNAINIKGLRFKELAIISIVSSLLSGAIAIWMAYTGWGVWSIMARNILNAFITCVLNWMLCKWLPAFIVSIQSLKSIWGYSTRMFATTVMEILVQRMDVLVMGRVYNTATVGYYTRAQSLDNISRELTSGSMASVFFPYFSKIQNNIPQVRALYLKCLHVVSFVLLLLSGMLFLNADDIFVLLFTNKWLPSAALYKVLTIIGFFYAVTVIMNIMLAGIGKSKEFLRAEIFKKLLIFLAFVYGFSGSLQQFLYALLIAYVLGMLIMMIFVSNAIQVNMFNQLSVVLRYVTIAVIAATASFFLVQHKLHNTIANVLLVSAVFGIIYIFINFIAGSKALVLIVEQVKFYLSKTRWASNFKA